MHYGVALTKKGAVLVSSVASPESEIVPDNHVIDIGVKCDFIPKTIFIRKKFTRKPFWRMTPYSSGKKNVDISLARKMGINI